MFYLVCTTADKHSCKKNVFFLNSIWRALRYRGGTGMNQG